VPPVDLLVKLFSSKLDLIGVDNDEEISLVYMGRKIRTVLTLKKIG
jgi:hypothetical protein